MEEHDTPRLKPDVAHTRDVSHTEDTVATLMRDLANLQNIVLTDDEHAACLLLDAEIERLKGCVTCRQILRRLFEAEHARNPHPS